MKSLITGTAALVLAWGAAIAQAQGSEPLVVRAVLSTEPLFNYEDAPATPDADDPAVWIDRRNSGRSLIIGTAKDAGLLVYDLSGNLVQAILPPNAPTSHRAIRPHQAARTRRPGSPAPTVTTERHSAGSTTLTSPTTCDSARTRARRARTWRSSRIGDATAWFARGPERRGSRA